MYLTKTFISCHSQKPFLLISLLFFFFPFSTVLIKTNHLSLTIIKHLFFSQNPSSTVTDFYFFSKQKKKNKFGASKKSFSFMSSIGADDFDFTPAATRSPNVERLLNHYTLPSEVLRDSLWQHSGLILPTSYRFPILASSSIFPLWREELLKLMVRIQDLYFLSEAPSRPIHPHQHLLPTSFQRSYWI